MKSYVKPDVPLSHYFVIGTIIVAVFNPVLGDSYTPSDLVGVDVYYESLCYDSIQFFKDQLIPTFRELGNYMNVRYIPYGKATHVKVFDRNGIEKWRFSCQHGSAECDGNKAQACGINEILTNSEITRKQQDLVNFVGCVMSARYPPNAISECLRTIGINENRRTLVNDCISSAKGDDLLAAYGDQTLALQPSVTFVPTIVLNGEFTHQNQRSALDNLKGLICQKISTSPKPENCNGY